MSHGRKFRNGKSHPLPVWSGILEHRKRLGLAIYEFIWCIDKVTQESPTGDDGKSDGLVLGGACVKIKDIAKDLEEDYRTAQRNMDLLESEKYITRKRTAYGFSIRVHNSKKFKIWGVRVDKNVQSGVEESGQKCPVSTLESGQKCPVRVDKSVRNKEDHAVDHAAKETKQASRLAVWEFLGVDGSRWAPPIRELCTNLYQARSGQTAVELAGACMDGIEALGAHIPPALARRGSELRAQGRVSASEPIPELEGEPWQK